MNYKLKLYMARVIALFIFAAFSYATWHNPDEQQQTENPELMSGINSAASSESQNSHSEKKDRDKKKVAASTVVSTSKEQGQLVPGITDKTVRKKKKSTKPISVKGTKKAETGKKQTQSKDIASAEIIPSSGLVDKMKDRISKFASIELEFSGSVDDAMNQLDAVPAERIKTLDPKKYLVDTNGEERYFGAMVITNDGQANRLILPRSVQNKIFKAIIDKSYKNLSEDNMAMVKRALIHFNNRGTIINVDITML